MKLALNLRPYVDRLLSLLRVTTVARGLEISDSALRFVYMKNGAWAMTSVRLAPGVSESGKIKDEMALAQALRELRLGIAQNFQPSKMINVIVVLSSLNIY